MLKNEELYDVIQRNCLIYAGINFRIGEKKSNLSQHMSRMLYVEYTETSWKGNFSK